MYIDTLKSPYNIKPDNKDNVAGLMRLQKDMAASKEKCYPFFQSGIILSSFTRWTHAVRSFKVIGNDTTFKSLYKPAPGEKADEAQERGLFAGEMMQNNLDTYNGKKEYVKTYPIETARAGDKQITLKQPLFIPSHGQELFIRAGDLFAGGSPRACRVFDWIEVDKVFGNEIHLTMPLTEDYFDYDGAEIHILNDYCEHAEFEGITFDGNFAYPAMNLRLTNCAITNWLWLSECKNIFIKDCYAEKVEADKLFHNAFIDGLITPSSPSNGSGRNIEVINSHTGSLRLCPRYLAYDNNTIWADEVIENELEGKYGYKIPCIANAPAANPVRRLTLSRQSFTSSSRSLADSNVEFAALEEIII